jgi:hypothetical protein
MLVADGWVEYPYSQTMFAAWQAGAKLNSPSLEAQDSEGNWHALLPEFGYPAGMPRRISVPLRRLPPGCRVLRLRSNMQVYWDRLAVAYAEPPLELRRHVLPLREARVAKTGFQQRTNGPQFRPHYDYHVRSPFWDARYLEGFYTEIGPAISLVDGVDDALAIIGSGEEVHLEFDSLTSQPGRGWTRHFVLETYGWTKDMDLYTRDGDTVEPIPRGNRGDPKARSELHQRLNRRYQAGL